MANPQFIEEKPLSLVDVKAIFHNLEQRDKQLNYLSNKAKEHLEIFVTLSAEKKEDLHQKLANLKIVRLKEEHICKIIDFLPTREEELKVILQSYPLSLSKKDQEIIINQVKSFV